MSSGKNTSNIVKNTSFYAKFTLAQPIKCKITKYFRHIQKINTSIYNLQAFAPLASSGSVFEKVEKERKYDKTISGLM